MIAEHEGERPHGGEHQRGVDSGGDPQDARIRARTLRRLLAHPFAPLVPIVAIAVILRLATAAQIRESPLSHLHHWSETDMHFYHGWAESIVAGDLLTARRMKPYHSWHMRVARAVHAVHAAAGAPEPFDDAIGRRLWDRWLGERTFYQDPLYPYLVACVYAVAGPDVQTVAAVQTGLGIASVVLVFALARGLFDPTVALVAGVAAALFGPLVFYEHMLLRSVLNTFLALATLTVAVRALDPTAARRWFVGTGFFAGLSVLAQSSALLIAGWIALVVLAAAPRWRSRGTRVAGLALGFGLAIAPLVARNVAVGVAPFSLAATGGVTFLNHNTPDYDPFGGDALSPAAAEILVRTHGRLWPTMRATLATHPDAASVCRLFLRKLAAFWNWHEVPNNGNYYYFCLYATGLAWAGLTFATIGPCGAIGLGLGAARSRATRLVAGAIACGIATSVVFYHLARFRLPVACMLLPFAAYAVVTIPRRFRDGHPRRAGLIAVAVILVGVACWRPLPPNRPHIWVADYGVGNEIVGHLARRRIAAGDLAAAAALVERQLAVTEPAELSDIDPAAGATPVSLLAGELAGSFAPLHALAANIAAASGAPARALVERRRALVLGHVAAQFERRRGP